MIVSQVAGYRLLQGEQRDRMGCGVGISLPKRAFSVLPRGLRQLELGSSFRGHSPPPPPFGRMSPACLLADHDHRRIRRLRDRGADRAEQHTLEASPPVASNNDQLRLL